MPWQLRLPGESHIHHGVRARTAKGIVDADVAARRVEAGRLTPASESRQKA